MVTDRYTGAHGIQPGSLMAALATSAAMVSGLVLASPTVQQAIEKKFQIRNIALQPPKPEPKPDLAPVTKQTLQTAPQPKPVDPVVAIKSASEAPFTPLPDPGPVTGIGTGPIAPPQPLPTATPTPVMIGASVDPRFARDLQPLYPASEQRAGREGLVTVRVLIGADGRVKQVERVAAASDAFYAATERQALARWRFKPATRDGVAVEAWRTMTVRFEIPE